MLSIVVVGGVFCHVCYGCSNVYRVLIWVFDCYHTGLLQTVHVRVNRNTYPQEIERCSFARPFANSFFKSYFSLSSFMICKWIIVFGNTLVLTASWDCSFFGDWRSLFKQPRFYMLPTQSLWGGKINFTLEIFHSNQLPNSLWKYYIVIYITIYSRDEILMPHSVAPVI